MKKIIVFFGLALFLLSCDDNGANADLGDAPIQIIEIVAEGELSASVAVGETLMVIDDSRNMEEMCDSLGILSTLGQETLTDLRQIDFSQSVVLLFYRGMQNSTGYHASFGEATVFKDSIVVPAIRTNPSTNCPVDAALTYPYVMGRTKRTTKAIIFSDSLMVACGG